MSIKWGPIYGTKPWQPGDANPDGGIWGEGGIIGEGGEGDNAQTWHRIDDVNLTLTLVIGGVVLPDLPPLTDVPKRAWRPIVTLDDEDVSDGITGPIEIRAAEGAARVASYTLLLAPGTVLSLAAWSGRETTIDYAEFIDGEIASCSRLFTGVIDTPEFDAQSGAVSILATDDLQTLCDAMSDEQIDALCGGCWSPVIFDAARSIGWQRALDRMSTVASSLDLDVFRTPRITPWQRAPSVSAAGPSQGGHAPPGGAASGSERGSSYRTLTANDIEDGSLAITLAPRDSLINRVDIAFDYRYPLAEARTVRIDFDCVDWANRMYFDGHRYAQNLNVAPFNFATFLLAGWNVLKRDAVMSALGSCGGLVEDVAWTEVPPSQWLQAPNGSVFAWVTSEGLRQQLCMGFSARISMDNMNEQEENHRITVVAPASVSQSGVLKEDVSSSLQGAYYDGPQVETQTGLYRSKVALRYPPTETGIVRQTGMLTTARLDNALSPDSNRDAANAAMECLIAAGKARIVASHRQTEVSATTVIDPEIDLDRHLRIEAPRVTAAGKVASLTHLMDTDSGRAVTSFELAVSTVCGVGVTHPESAFVAPPGVNKPPKGINYVMSTSPYGQLGLVPSGGGGGSNAKMIYCEWHGMMADANLNGGPPMDGQDFLFVFPGIDEEDRKMMAAEIYTEVNAGLYEDEFEVTA